MELSIYYKFYLVQLWKNLGSEGLGGNLNDKESHQPVNLWSQVCLAINVGLYRRSLWQGCGSHDKLHRIMSGPSLLPSKEDINSCLAKCNSRPFGEWETRKTWFCLTKLTQHKQARFSAVSSVHELARFSLSALFPVSVGVPQTFQMILHTVPGRKCPGWLVLILKDEEMFLQVLWVYKTSLLLLFYPTRLNWEED